MRMDCFDSASSSISIDSSLYSSLPFFVLTPSKSTSGSCELSAYSSFHSPLLSSFPTSIFSSSKSSSKLSTNSGPAEYSRSSSSSIDASRDKKPPRGDSGALSSRGEYSDAEDAARFPEMYMFTRESERGIVVRDLRSIPAGTPTADSA